jgi:redox-sensing transcriptional repressor
MNHAQPSEPTIERLSVYLRLLRRFAEEGRENVYSHELAARAGATATQVRRDIMATGFSGSPTRGYSTDGLADAIEEFLDGPSGAKVVVLGVGNLGRAILGYVGYRRARLSIVAAFDRDPEVVGRVIQGIRCYGLEELPAVVKEHGACVAVLTVPTSEAQKAADAVVAAGVRGILNFAPVRLRVPATVYVEDLDVTGTLDKVAYFARLCGPP